MNLVDLDKVDLVLTVGISTVVTCHCYSSIVVYKCPMQSDLVRVVLGRATRETSSSALPVRFPILEYRKTLSVYTESEDGPCVRDQT